jgi:indolepyruvate ferredoxin oxidoreductase alpha subunit
MAVENERISGALALAQGALDAGVALVAGYPGAPVTDVVNHIVRLTTPDAVHVEWNSNEKVAIEMAFGASVGGMRALLCVKSVGMNIALDPLMAFNMTGCNAGLVLLVGDDPGAWGSQNEQDSRGFAWMAELPMLEPATVTEARAMMAEAFRLSEKLRLPVMVRITRALAQREVPASRMIQGDPLPSPPDYQRESMRYVVLPVNVVPYHRRLLEQLDAVRARFEMSPFNAVMGEGSYGVVAAGFAFQKLLDALGGEIPPALRVLRLGTCFPQPTAQITAFLQSVTSVLVIEETAPWIEQAVRVVAQQSGLALPIDGRETGFIPRSGELFPAHIAEVLNRWLPDLALLTDGPRERPLPSREPFCEGCPYIPTVEALVDVMDAHGGRDAFIVTGDPGCMVKAQMPPYELLDVKNSLGSSIGTAAGLAVSQQRANGNRHVVALAGDSAFLHSGLGGLVDAARIGAPLLVIILDNGTTALSGGQPHPATGMDARRAPKGAVDMETLVRAAGVDFVRAVDVNRGNDVHAVIEAGLQYDGVAVVIARGPCVRWPR